MHGLVRDDLLANFGLLLCREEVQPFYQNLGWQVVNGPLVFEQPGVRLMWPLSVMILPCRGTEWPDGVIDLRGLPW
jgi:hypothetical protein